jgi:hypothetical protein
MDSKQEKKKIPKFSRNCCPFVRSISQFKTEDIVAFLKEKFQMESSAS